MNKKFIILLTVFIILTSAFFGVFMFSFAHNSDLGICPFALGFLGGDCSYMNNSLQVAMHHISGIQNITNGFLSFFRLSIISVFLLIFIFIIVAKEISIGDIILKIRYKFLKFFSYPVFARILKLIALHNKLDIYSYAGVSENFKS